jgi:hypothetical protein
MKSVEDLDVFKLAHREVLLLIDDWRPYEAAQAAGVEVINSLAYLVALYEQKRITLGGRYMSWPKQRAAEL